MVDNIGTAMNAIVLPYWVVTAIAVVPRGAYPSYAHGMYARDNAFYQDWDAISRDRETFLAWMKENVLAKNAEAFRQYAAKAA